MLKRLKIFKEINYVKTERLTYNINTMSLKAVLTKTPL